MTERWKPEYGEEYWLVNMKGFSAYHLIWLDDLTDNKLLEFGNCFRTCEEAEAAAEKVKALLLSLHEPEMVTPQPEQIWMHRQWKDPVRVCRDDSMIEDVLVEYLDGYRARLDPVSFTEVFDFVREAEDDLHKNPENLGTSSEPSQKVGKSQRLPKPDDLWWDEDHKAVRIVGG